jgi:hypothetical protein
MRAIVDRKLQQGVVISGQFTVVERFVMATDKELVLVAKEKGSLLL